MSNIKVKLQLGDKTKMMARKPYSSVQELKTAVESTYPKRLANKAFRIKYQDEDNEWMYISDDQDTTSFNEYAINKTGKKVRVIVEAEGKDQAMEEDKNINEGLEELSLEDDKNVKFEDLKDFKINDAMLEVEKLFNSEDKFGPMKIFKVFINAAEGTKAERHLKRMMKRLRKNHRGPGHGFRDLSGHKGGRKHCRQHRDQSSSLEGFQGEPSSFGPPAFGPPFHGRHGGRGHFGHNGHHGHCASMKHQDFQGRGCGKGKGKAMKFFKQFFQTYKDKSNTSSSEEVSVEPKPVISNLPEETETSAQY
jgi:hypothetical protein